LSLKAISEATGASVSTISRVLNNPSYQCQNPDMTEKIREAARSLGYVPNQNARQLKLGSHDKSINEAGRYVVDILLARFDTLDKDPFFSEVFRIAETEFYKQNCTVGKILNVPDISLITANNMHTRADGLLILGKCPADIVEELLRQYRGTIAIDRNPMEYKMDEVICNGSHAAAIAVEYLLELGHKKIAYVGDCNMETRYMGYYECLLSHKIPLTYDYVIPTNQTREDGYRAFERVLTCKNRPTAVFCANDVTALGFLEAMKEKNGRRKKQIYRPAVISIDDIEEASSFSPMLTTVRIPKEDMVHLAVLTLRDRLMKGHKENIRLETPCHLMVRESSGVHL
jgi:DNA-binding LacI/PurR family transcriptional regulator